MQKNKENSVIDTLLNHKAISIDTFSVFPPEIDGCACYFSNNNKEFENDKYIYADDYISKAFISINGVLIQFILSKTDTLSDDHYIKTYSNKMGEIILDVKQVGQIDETWQKAGIITIRLKGSEEIVKNIYGECGC